MFAIGLETANYMFENKSRIVLYLAEFDKRLRLTETFAWLICFHYFEESLGCAHIEEFAWD